MMVTNHNPPFQSTESILWVLELNNYNYYNIIKALNYNTSLVKLAVLV